MAGNEKSYKRTIENGVEFLKKTIQAKNPKKKVSLGIKSVNNFRKAISISKEIGLENKIQFLNEYLQQILATLGAGYLELKKIEEAIKTFEEALDANSRTPQNTKQKEIRSFIFAELAKIYFDINNIQTAEKYANQALQLGSAKNFNQEDLLDLYIEMNPIYIGSGNLNKISKNFHAMVKIAKRDKRKHLKAQVYFAYGKFLWGIKKEEVESMKYLKKSQTLFQTLGSAQGLAEVDKYIEEKIKKLEEINPEPDDINTT
jgi:tetratricopeptide (TPR) repeat protein